MVAPAANSQPPTEAEIRQRVKLYREVAERAQRAGDLVTARWWWAEAAKEQRIADGYRLAEALRRFSTEG